MEQEDLQLIAKLVFAGSTIVVAIVGFVVVAIAGVRVWRGDRRGPSHRRHRRHEGSHK